MYLLHYRLSTNDFQETRVAWRAVAKIQEVIKATPNKDDIENQCYLEHYVCFLRVCRGSW